MQNLSTKINAILFFSLILALPYNSIAQTKIQIKVKQTHTSFAKLFFLKPDNEVIVDSVYKTSSDQFNFQLRNNYERGLYKLRIGKNISFDFIVGEEPEIILETVIFAVEDSLKSIKSDENKIYIQYRKLKRDESQLSWLLSSARSYYSVTSPFGYALDDEIFRIKSEFNKSAFNLAKNNPGLLTSKLIQLDLRPIVPKGLSNAEQRSYSLIHWWENSDLNDSALLNFKELNKKLWDYLDLIFNDNLDKEEQDSAFIEGVKVVLSLNADVSIKNYFRNSIYQELVETDYKSVADYVVSLPVKGLTPIIRNDEYNLRNDNSIKPGQKAMDFKITGRNGKTKISEIKSRYKLLVFWSSWCPHCLEMLPELKRVYQIYRNKGFEVIAISIDEEVDSCNAVIADNKLDWVNDNINNLSSGKIMDRFKVDETPKFFLLDRSLTLISVPSNVKQLEVKLRKLLK